MLNVCILTLFPDMFPGPLGMSILGRAMDAGSWTLSTKHIRDYATDKHNTVDDTPYGGGAGMVMRPDVVAAAIRDAKKEMPNAHVVYMSPSGKPFKQDDARRLAKKDGLILLCGHYEGIDQRVLDSDVDEELSIGDYVLSGGEIASMIVCDAVVRMLPKALGAEASLEEESFDIQSENGDQLLEYPHYTRPVEWEGVEVPQVLRSGHHGKISEWRLDQSKKRTQNRRPDLFK